jgi:hypothetical protein
MKAFQGSGFYNAKRTVICAKDVENALQNQK